MNREDGGRFSTNGAAALQLTVLMKTLQSFILGLLLASSAFAGDTTNDADQKWSAAVEKKIAAGNTTISTPSEKRAEIAKQLAEKAGRKAEVSKVETGYRIKVS